VLDAFARITPEILKTETWTDVHLEAFDYLKFLRAKKGE
jgi:hypothetical protein